LPPEPAKDATPLEAIPPLTQRIPSLDGLRAISVTLVILSHVVLNGFIRINPPLRRLFFVGDLGVQVFFVISGFLITTLLLRELDTVGRIDLKAFYFRRTLRIWPPFYTYLLVVGVAVAAGALPAAGFSRSLLSASTFIGNYSLPSMWCLEHTWSLAVEEQFYFLWPAVVVIFGRLRALRSALIVVLLGPAIRLGELLFGHRWPALHERMGFSFETACDSIAIGCVLAGLRTRLASVPAYVRFLGSRYFFIVPLSVLAIEVFFVEGQRRFTYLSGLLVGHTLQNVGIALSIDWCLRFPSGMVGRLLNSRPLVTVGLCSYSIYLWQQLWLRPDSALTALSALLLTATCAAGSYLLIERPMHRLRRRHDAPHALRRAQAND